MEWLNLHTSTLDSPEFIGADPTQRATWLCLMRYCAGQENSGIIFGAAQWSDRKLQQLVRVTRAEVENSCDLWRVAGADIEINFYPVAKEKQVKAGRGHAMAGASARWEKRSLDALTHALTPTLAANKGNAEGKEKGREEEGKEKGKGVPVSPAVVFPLPLDTPAFTSAWGDWCAYRRERRLATLKPRSAEAQLAKLAEWGHDTAIDSIRESIAQNWQGLFEPKAIAGVSGKPRPAGTSDEMAKRLGYQPGM
jgi:hypothetical protein